MKLEQEFGKNVFQSTPYPVPIKNNESDSLFSSNYWDNPFTKFDFPFSYSEILFDYNEIPLDYNETPEYDSSINNIVKDKSKVVNDMYNTGLQEGLTKAQVCGILGNVMQESGFNGNAKGDNGKSIGYFQMGPGEQERYRKWKLRNSSRIAGQPEHVRQMMYICDAIKSKDYKPLNIYGIRNVSFNSNDPKETAANFMIRYEKPNKKNAALSNREKYAKDFYNYFK